MIDHCDSFRWLKQLLLLLLLLVVDHPLACQTAIDDFAAQCLLGVPSSSSCEWVNDQREQPLSITAQQGILQGDTHAEFCGEVTAWQGQWRLFSDKLKFDNAQLRILQACGRVHYQDPLIYLWAGYASYAPESKQLVMEKVRYQWVGRQGRGHASKLQQSAGLGVIYQGDFTTCPPGDNSWQIKAARIEVHHQSQFVELWHARWLLAGIPLLYTPYWQLPIGDQRRSGFLTPHFQWHSSRNSRRFNKKFSLSLPYYWNIAPNFDATITPNYIGNRGLQWQLIGNYLLIPGLGTVAYDYLPRDRDRSSLASRYLFHWQHNGIFKRHWHFHANHTRVSDRQYFSDLQSSYGNATDNYATQEYRVEYRQTQWESQLLTRNFQWFYGDDKDSQQRYRLQPQWSSQFFAPPGILGGCDFQLGMQLSQFKSHHPLGPSATRMHVVPVVQRAWQNSLGNSQLSAKLFATYYQQKGAQCLGVTKERGKQRLLPQWTFEHSGLWSRSIEGRLLGYQILQPRVRYLYRPYYDHRQLMNYDSSRLQPGYHSLFVDQQWSGADRINAVNQLSLGLTSRWLDSRWRERGSLSLGYLYPLSAERTGIATEDNFQGNGTNYWVLAGSGLLSNRCSLQGKLQFHKLGRPMLGETMLEYRFDGYRMLQFNGQFATQQAVQKMGASSSSSISRIMQLGCISSWLFNQRWVVIAGCYYDLQNQKWINHQVGMQYNSCCWAIGINYQRELTNYEHKFTLSLQLRGLKPGSHDLGSEHLLKNSILPYQRPLFLPQ